MVSSKMCGALAPLAALASMAAFSGAAVAEPDTAAKLAAAGIEVAGPLASSDRGTAGNLDSIWLMAENAVPAAIDGAAEEDTILAAFSLSAPDDVEETVAKDFGVEIVSRLRLQSLGVRIARYRVPDLRPIEGVADLMRLDRRVIGAQLNVRYQGIPAPAPETEVGSVKAPSSPSGTGEAADKPPQADASKPSQAMAHKPQRRRDASAAAARTGPPRSASVTVGDVLSGGF